MEAQPTRVSCRCYLIPVHGGTDAAIDYGFTITAPQSEANTAKGGHTCDCQAQREQHTATSVRHVSTLWLPSTHERAPWLLQLYAAGLVIEASVRQGCDVTKLPPSQAQESHRAMQHG